MRRIPLIATLFLVYRSPYMSNIMKIVFQSHNFCDQNILLGSDSSKVSKIK